MFQLFTTTVLVVFASVALLPAPVLAALGKANDE